MPTMPQSPATLAKNRPAESAGVVGAVVVLVAKVLGITDPDTLIALTVVVGALPALVTALVVVIGRRASASGGS